MERKVIIPNAFKARYKEILGDDNKRFLKYCMMPLRKSIRVNTLKISVKELKERLERKGYRLKRIPWIETGFWVEKEEDMEALGNTEEHFLGYFYVQEASSMIPPIVLNPNENDVVLDMSAAPGSKTTQMAEMMGNKGIIIANDPNYSRLKALKYNIDKAGAINVVVTNMDGRKFGKKSIKFDKILLDAPCSSEGTIRKEWKVLSRWSERMIKDIARLQKKLILSAFDSLKKGGVMVYSTCTHAPEENEGVLDYLLKKRENAKIVDFEVKGLKARKGVSKWREYEYNKDVEKSKRVWPQDNDSEGFFISKIIKV